MKEKVTLVVVDFQYDFCLLGAPLYVPGSDRALWNISHLIENKKIGEVIFTAETYKEIPRWQYGEDILKGNKFLVVDVAHFNSEDIPHDEVKVIYAPDITICSTAIRKWVDDGKIILPFVTDEVNSIIRKLGLYK
jgi:nicotinic acid mononucleotide adenylyltransferase